MNTKVEVKERMKREGKRGRERRMDGEGGEGRGKKEETEDK